MRQSPKNHASMGFGSLLAEIKQRKVARRRWRLSSNDRSGAETWVMLDNAFQRRREIERMLLSGKRLTTSGMMARYGVGRNAIRRDFDIIGEELPVVSKQGYDGGYFLIDGVGQHQNSLSHEQLECLETVAASCGTEDRETILSIIHEFGPYCEKNT